MAEVQAIPAPKTEPVKTSVEKNLLPEKKNSDPKLCIQPKLTVGAPDDPYEKEADAVAGHVMRMPEQNFVQHKCAECEKEKKIHRQVEKDELFGQAKFISGHSFIQRKCAECEKDEKIHRKQLTGNITSFIQTKSNGESTASDSLSSSIQNSRGNGSSLDNTTKSFMESGFGADFSSVKIHTGSESVQMNRELNAQAFTVGSDVYFNEGKYQPHSSDGKQLLAHELTHVVQQTPNLQKKDMIQSCQQQRTETADLVIRRKYFHPDSPISGTAVHNTVLPMFVQNNKDLFIEVAIPGSNKDWVSPERSGFADFYKAESSGGKSRTIGLKFDDEPAYLRQSGKLEFGGGTYNHNKDAAPKGGKLTPKARSMNDAPTMIQIGDLKPGGSGEAILGGNQVKNYSKGITDAATALNKYLAANPKETDGAKSWGLLPASPSPMSSLTIPAKLVYPTGSGIAKNRLAVYDLAGRKIIPDSGLAGSMYVYKDPQSGIWSYEWIPDNIPASTGSGLVNDVLNRLNKDVIPPLISPGATGIKPKLIKNNISETPQSKQRIQKKDEKFDDAKWKTTYFTPWKTDAEKFLGNKSEVDKVQVAEALNDVKGRNSAVSVPAEVEERGKGLSKIKHWKRFGGIFGWLREKFDFIFVKVHGFAKKIKDKVQKLVKKVGATSFGSWVKAAAKVVFKIFKMVGAWVVGQVLDKLVDSLKEGIFNNIKKLIDMITPDEAKAKIQEFEELKEKYQKIIEEKEDELIKRFFGDKLEFFEKLEKFEAIADTLSTIATLVEWGVRLLACASPPAIGCLWNLAISALQAAFAWLMQTCWFTKKVYEPVISNVDLVRNFPAEIASKIVGAANEYIPVPAGFDPIFAPIVINTGGFKVDCDEAGDGSGGLTGEREAIMKLINEIGPDKFNALLELSIKRGAGKWVLLTAERLAELKEALKDVNTKDLKEAAKDKTKGTPEPLDDFLKDIKAYSAGEKKLIKEAADTRKSKEAAEATKKGGGGAGGTGESDLSQNPIYGKPEKLNATLSGVMYACVIDGNKLEEGKKYSDSISIYLGVYFTENKKFFKILINGVEVKIGLVNKDLVEFIIQKDFYAKYDDDKHLVFFPKGKTIKIAKDKIIYTSDL